MPNTIAPDHNDFVLMIASFVLDKELITDTLFDFVVITSQELREVDQRETAWNTLLRLWDRPALVDTIRSPRRDRLWQTCFAVPPIACSCDGSFACSWQKSSS